MTIATLVSLADKPRIISEVKKSKQTLIASKSSDDVQRCKISGELLWSATPTEWHVKLGEVRHGYLIVYSYETGSPEFQLPLHHLNLQPNQKPRTFTLTTATGIPLATFQALTEEEYQRWVRVLAVEVLKQTPLHHVRYLDIIGITREDQKFLRGNSEEFLSNMCPKSDKFVNKSGEEDYKTNEKHHAEFSKWLHCVKNEDKDRTNFDFDLRNMKIRRAQKVRPKLPFADTWQQLHGARTIYHRKNLTHVKQTSISLEDLRPKQTRSSLYDEGIKENTVPEKVVSDESGISSGDENNNNLVSDNSQTSPAEPTYISVREKKQFFESLNDLTKVKKPTTNLDRSNSIGNIATKSQVSGMMTNQRACSMQDLSTNLTPVKQMKRFFEIGSNNRLTKSYDKLKLDKDSVQEEDEETCLTSGFVSPVQEIASPEISYASIQFCKNPAPKTDERGTQCTSKAVEEPKEIVDNNASHSRGVATSPTSTLLIERKLQRGDRKLTKLRIQIAEVEDTIRIIAKDLHSISPATLKKRAGLEVFAALRRRLEEESSRLERLQEETTKVILENQRTIRKMVMHNNNRQIN